MRRDMPDEIEESEEQFKSRIFEAIRLTIVQCWTDDHGHAPQQPPNDEVVKQVVIHIATRMGPPENMGELIEKTRRLYRETMAQNAARKGLN